MKFKRIALKNQTIISLGEFKAVYDHANPEYGYVVFQKDEPFIGGLTEENAMSAMGQYHMENDPRVTHHAEHIIN